MEGSPIATLRIEKPKMPENMNEQWDEMVRDAIYTAKSIPEALDRAEKQANRYAEKTHKDGEVVMFHIQKSLEAVFKEPLPSSRRHGIFTALGVAAGIPVHVAYCILGLGFVISQSIVAFSILKFLGAAYLCYIGFGALRARAKNQTIEIGENSQTISVRRAFKMGLATNALNPKATIFFLSVFTQLVTPGTPIIIQAWYGIIMTLIIGLWFVALASTLSHSVIRGRIQGVQHWIERAMGAVLIALGIKLALSTQKN